MTSLSQNRQSVDEVRASRAGHTFHERWAARRALQLIFPKDNLFAIVVEGLSPNENLKLGKEAEDIADLTLFYGEGDTFDTCEAQQILQFKYKVALEPVTSSYLKKTIKKFSKTLKDLKKVVPEEEIAKKLSFGFVTNAEFTENLWCAISCLKSGGTPQTGGAKRQLQYLQAWCQEENIDASEIFPLIEFRASTSDLPRQNRCLRKTVSDWSANVTGQAAKRLFALVELVREKSQIEGQGNNAIRREDVLDALECDEDQLFPADTRFVDVGDVVERGALRNVKEKILCSNRPVFLHADGGVGKTVFIQSLAAHISDTFEVVVFDCFGGGSYRSEAQARHLPRIGLLQIINELATRGLCDPLLPTDSDQYGLIQIARKRLNQASDTLREQSALQGILIVLDAVDNAQLEADVRNEVAFPRLLLSSLSSEPIEGVKLLLTARPHRMHKVIGVSEVERFKLKSFSEEETRQFLKTRRDTITDVEFSTVLARSRGNARVLEYLVESWDTNVSGDALKSQITVEELIAQKCKEIFHDLHTAGWDAVEVCEFFAALSLLPPPIPLFELAQALGWQESQVNSAASDLAPMLELVKHGVIFRDEPTETYIREHYAVDSTAQQSIAQRLQDRQKDSIYAAEALPHFLVVIGDSNRAYQLANTDEFPNEIESEYELRSLKLARLYAAFSLATREKDFNRVLSLTMQLSQVASANARGDKFIRNSPALAITLGNTGVSRRLFNDRSGWRGARDARLIVAYCFTGDLDEACIHQSRAIGWVNWYLLNDDEDKEFERPVPEALDIAAILFLSVLKNEFSSFNRNIQIWNSKFALSVIGELILLCAHHEETNDSKVLQMLTNFAASKNCLSLTLQISLLSNECGLSKSTLKAISRAASALSQKCMNAVKEDNFDYEMKLQGTISSAAITSVIVNSRQSAKRLLKLSRYQKPSSYDYGERHGLNRMWLPVRSACIAAWSSGEPLSYHHLMPENVKTGQKTKAISTKTEMSTFLDSLIVINNQDKKKKDEPAERHKQFSQHEQENIVKGAACILQLVKPLEISILSKSEITNGILAEFLRVWKTTLRPDIHRNAETGKDNIARHVGIGLVRILLRHSETVEQKEAEDLIDIISANRFSLADKLSVLTLLARRSNLLNIAGAYANTLSSDILKDDYIEQRGEYYKDLAGLLLPMSVAEAQVYYRQGLAQLDQMGSDDFELIYSVLHYAAEQPGGFVKPAFSHRLMNLCQTIFQYDSLKFGWTLFARAASSSIGFPAIYKLLRWHDQDVAGYSYGLPQLACSLTKAGSMDPRRAALLLTICEDHGWHDWQIGDGLHDILSVAKTEDRKAIFSLVVGKLENEHSFNRRETLWESLLNCMDNFTEIDEKELREHIRERRDSARCHRELENARNNYNVRTIDKRLQVDLNTQDAQSTEDAFTTIFTKCDPTAASSLDEAIRAIQVSNQLQFEHRKRLFDDLRDNCPYAKRVKFLEAICESTELEFDSSLDLIIECVDAWREVTAHVGASIFTLIKKLFAFKGSELFDLRYSGISQQIYRLSNLCDDPKFVLQIVLETIAKERLELDGDEWLQLATSLCPHTDQSMALEAFENLLSSPAANIGDEIGEGPYRTAFEGKNNEVEVVSDIIWHLLGDSDAYVRWSTARSIKGMFDVGLTEDVKCLLNRFDVDENPSLASDEHHFAFLNAQQWLLIGLARAALYHGEKLKDLKPQLEALAGQSDLHLLNKLHVVRCLRNIEDGKSSSHEYLKLWNEVQIPPLEVVEREGWPEHKERRIDFRFDYEFNKYEVSGLARLFGISDNEACDYIADEVLKRFPDAKNMSDFSGGVRLRNISNERFESYREHIQKHALIHAATTLVKSKPTVRQSYDYSERTPWEEFLKEGDVSFQDGSWLSDHKDRVPAQAQEYLLGERKGNQERLLSKGELFRKIGFPEISGYSFLPLYGSWRSTDGVHVRFMAALIKERGAVSQCAKFAKIRAHDLWLPMFESDGRIDRYSEKGVFEPLIWEPNKYPIGIDEGDEWGTRGSIARPRLGLALNRILALIPDNNNRQWHTNGGMLALKNEVWGKWKPDPDTRNSRFQDDGTILWAEREWLDIALKTYNRSLIYKLSFSKYRLNRNYDESSGVRELYVGLKRSGELPRFWFAKKASETEY